MSEPERRQFLKATAGGLVAALAAGGASAQAPDLLEDPYDGVDWSSWVPLESMSHQHGGQTDKSRDLFYEMGYRHLAFSNYYPSAPTPLSEAWAAAHPDALGCPNAEHHSFTDAGLHCNPIGSFTSTGYGQTVPRAQYGESPIVAVFEGLNVFDAARPWDGLYRIDVRLSPQPGTTGGGARLTIDGGLEASARTYEVTGDGLVRDRDRTGSTSLYFRAMSPTVTITLTFDPKQTVVDLYRLMQGCHRPWREAFDLLLDGEPRGGQIVGGLEYPDGGGITLNHPTAGADLYFEMLDHDPRVLGIEVYNHLANGFGSTKSITDQGLERADRFYLLWDELLRSGRRCLGFFVNDHMSAGRGRNILLEPPPAGRSRAEREESALRSYRLGRFWGVVGAGQYDAAGALVSPFVATSFRFRQLALTGRTLAVEVGDHDADRRPQVQLRFVTDQGVEKTVDGPAGEFTPPAGRKYVRVEAFAYPTTAGGEALRPAAFGAMDVWSISQLHNHTFDASVFYNGGARRGDKPMGIVDLLFSQPVRWR